MDNYRLATLSDIDEVMVAVEDSRALLKEEGNGQWQFGYPNRDDFIEDINNNRLYVILDRINNKEIASVYALCGYEESYHHLYEGKWKTDYEYLVIHRVALKEKYRGLGYGKAIFDSAINETIKRGLHSLRIDTHEKNNILIHLIYKYGFEYDAAFKGCDASKDASITTIEKLTNKVINNQINVIFNIELSESSVARTIINNCKEEGINIELKTFYTVHNVSKDDFKKGLTYIDFMNINIENLKAAFNYVD